MYKYKYVYIGATPQNIVVSTYGKKQLLETGAIFESDIEPRQMRLNSVYPYNEETKQKMQERIEQYEATIEMKKEAEKQAISQVKAELDKRVDAIKKETKEQVEHFEQRMQQERLYIATMEAEEGKETKETKKPKK